MSCAGDQVTSQKNAVGKLLILAPEKFPRGKQWERQNWRFIHMLQLLQGSVSIFIYIFPTILVAGKREKKQRRARKNKETKSQNCSSSIMPPDQHNDASRDDIKPWSVLLDGLAEPGSPLAPKLHPNKSSHSLLVWLSGNPTAAQWSWHLHFVRLTQFALCQEFI